MQKRPFIIGIAGPSGAGKSHFANILSEELNAAVWQLDLYYKPRTQQQKDNLGFLNFNLPEALDLEFLLNDLNKLYQNQTIEIEEYNYNNKEAEKTKKTISPKDIIIVEGIHTYTWEKLSNFIDFKIFIDASKELRLKRRIERDKLERGYQLDEINYRFLKHAEDVYKEYLLPIKSEVDFLVELTENQSYPLDSLIQLVLAKKSAVGL